MIKKQKSSKVFGKGLLLSLTAAGLLALSNASPSSNALVPAPSSRYNGLFFERSPRANSTGGLTLVTTSGGNYVGKLHQGLKNYSFTGHINSNGGSKTTVFRSGTTPLNLQFSFSNNANQLKGSITDGHWKADVLANRDVYTVGSPTPQAGGYSIVFPNLSGANTLSYSSIIWGAVNVDDTGTVSFECVLPDQTVFSQNTSIASDNSCPFYSSFTNSAGATGSIVGWLHFDNMSPINIISGHFRLFTPSGGIVDGQALGSYGNPVADHPELFP